MAHLLMMVICHLNLVMMDVMLVMVALLFEVFCFFSYYSIRLLFYFGIVSSRGAFFLRHTAKVLFLLQSSICREYLHEDFCMTKVFVTDMLIDMNRECLVKVMPNRPDDVSLDDASQRNIHEVVR